MDPEKILNLYTEYLRWDDHATDPDFNKAEALAAIEAIRKADMEYVIGEDDGTYQRYLTVSKRLSIKDNQNQARTIKALLNIERRNQRQRMAERLNNTKEQV